MSKISVIGAAGNIGKTIVNNLVHYNICDEIVGLDINGDVVKGLALDILQSTAILGKRTKILGTSDYRDIANSDVVIVPAGFPRKPGMERSDLLTKNIEIISTVAEGIKKYAPNAFVIIITNPLDIMVYAAYKLLGFKKSHVVGMAGMLDGARLTYQVSQALDIEPDKINPMVIGAHNDDMVPLLRYTAVSGIPVSEFIENGMLSKEKANEIIQKVKTGGAEIVKYLGNGSAFNGPSIGAITMADSYVNNKPRIMSCCTFLEGEYGVNGYFVGAPVKIGKNGVEKVIELKLNSEEKAQFDKSIESIKKGIEELNKVFNYPADQCNVRSNV